MWKFEITYVRLAETAVLISFLSRAVYTVEAREYEHVGAETLTSQGNLVS